MIVLQNNLIDRLTAPLAMWAHAHGIEVIDLSWNDRTQEALGQIAPAQSVFIYGSTAFVRAARNTALASFVHWTPGAFVAARWVDRFGAAYVGVDGRTALAREVPALLPAAIRPNEEAKAFNGGIYDQTSWGELRLSPDIECFVMPISEISEEHRAWFVRGQLITASRYRKDGRMDVAPSDNCAIDAAVALSACLPLPTIVMDIALTPSGWRMLELNCVNTSGWYAADPGLIAGAILGQPIDSRAKLA
ncbi:ATP-grasp domain-containing protein [Phenylobacterium immobile]|uniref:ATP-grasp domain-containing protein n=1 Tax=Phenylobacterium immobile TaxID=21 RepID=UPI000A73E60B|nr:ATP-grasp domain-containing protein [Phenylobacterium immobile]